MPGVMYQTVLYVASNTNHDLAISGARDFLFVYWNTICLLEYYLFTGMLFVYWNTICLLEYYLFTL